MAYQKLYANIGASTPGVDKSDTADGFSEIKIHNIIEALKSGTYFPKPTRRVYINKRNGKKRPLGLPTFTDKLVQEALKIILQAVYEPVFLEQSHGFRPNMSCHTALKAVSKELNGVRWFIEGDIKGCFDNINHHILINRIRDKIKDARIIQLLWKFLKSGYLEDWRYNATYSGTPQGGIISPLLANVYLHELDKFIMKLKERFDKPAKQKCTKEYSCLKNKVGRLKRKIKSAQTDEEKQNLIKAWKEVRRKMLKTPAKSQTDKVVKYVRYADDFIIGINGSKEECQDIKQQIAEFMSSELHMELSAEKTLITHSSKNARFLGYDVRVRRNNEIKKTDSLKLPKRTLNNLITLSIPLKNKIEVFMKERRIMRTNKSGKLEPTHRKELLSLTPLEILTVYNSELRGLCNYYHMAGNYSKLNYFNYIMEYSCLKTLAAKFKTTIGKIKEKYRSGSKKWAIPYNTKAGRKLMYFAEHQRCREKKIECDDTMSTHAIMFNYSRNTLEKRLKAHVCEICGRTDAEQYEIHHIHKVKDLTGVKLWERSMIAKRRKTMVVCRECHKEIHGGK